MCPCDSIECVVHQCIKSHITASYTFNAIEGTACDTAGNLSASTVHL